VGGVNKKTNKKSKTTAMEEHRGVCVCVCVCVCLSLSLSLSPDLWCLLSWAARSSSWMFLVICSVLRMTSSVLGSARSASASGGPSGWRMEEEPASPSHPLLLSLPLRLRLLLLLLLPPRGEGGGGDRQRTEPCEAHTTTTMCWSLEYTRVLSLHLTLRPRLHLGKPLACDEMFFVGFNVTLFSM